MHDQWVDEVVAVLRREGALVIAADKIEDVAVWRSEVRKACRKAGLRIRTGVTDNGTVWVDHVDHVSTDAELRAAGRAVSDLLSGKPGGPLRDLVREEQRRRLAVVDGGGAVTGADERSLNGANGGAKRDLPGEVDAIVIDYSSRQHTFKDVDERSVPQWYAEILCTDDNGEPAHKVGSVLAYTMGFEAMSDPFGLMDAESADLGHIAGVLFDADGDLDPDLLDQLEALGEGFLLLDWVRLEREWRGHGLGLLVAGMVIEDLGAGRGFVVLQAAPSERRNAGGEVVEKISKSERAAAVMKLGALWSELGFEFFKDEVWILDLGLRTFTDRMLALRRRLGLR